LSSKRASDLINCWPTVGIARTRILPRWPTRPVDIYVATQKQKHGEWPKPCPRGPLPKTAMRTERMARKLQTKRGSAAYAARKAMVEPVIGQIKQARGFRQLFLRGVAKVRGEWAMVCMTHNVLKMYRACYG
jgi:hypothetical protein